MQTIFQGSRKRLDRPIFYIQVYHDSDGIPRYRQHDTREHRLKAERSGRRNWDLFDAGRYAEVAPYARVEKSLYRINVRRRIFPQENIQ